MTSPDGPARTSCQLRPKLTEQTPSDGVDTRFAMTVAPEGKVGHRSDRHRIDALRYFT